MSNNYGSRKPLHMQKGGQKASPSFESFRPNKIHAPQYGPAEMKDRPSTHSKANIRRYPDGRLDYEWVVNLVLDAIKKAETEVPLTPMEESWIMLIIPGSFPKVESKVAEVRTQLSRSERENVKQLVEARLKEEENWNAGLGGGSVEGRTRTTKGAP